MIDPTSPDGMPPLPAETADEPLTDDDAFTAMFDAVDRSIVALKQAQAEQLHQGVPPAIMNERAITQALPQRQAAIADLRGHDRQDAATALDIMIAATYMREPTMRDGLLAVYQMGVDSGADR